MKRMLPRVLLAALFLTSAGVAVGQEKKGEEPKEEGKKGIIVGVVTAKGPNFIEVKAPGEAKARRYVPHWTGGQPAQGGGPDKKMLAKIKEVRVGSRVRLNWEFEERPRVVEIQVLQAPAGEPRKEGEKKGEKQGER